MGRGEGEGKGRGRGRGGGGKGEREEEGKRGSIHYFFLNLVPMPHCAKLNTAITMAKYNTGLR